MEKFKKYGIILTPQNTIFENINYINDELWRAFRNFYILCISTKGLVEYFDRPLPDDLINASYNYFQEIKNTPAGNIPDIGAMCDYYFENYTPIWNLSNQRNKALLYEVFDMTRIWEKGNSFALHKGTLFYFWATTDLIHGDYDEGIILMHKALEEDRRKSGGSRMPDTPAHDFVSMNEKLGAYLQPITQDMVDFIKRRLDKYNNERGGQLKYQDLRLKFLDSKETKFEDIKFYFCYTILRWRRLRKIDKQRNIADNQMAPLIISGLIADLLLIIDSLLKIVLSSVYKKSKKDGKIYFSDHLYEIAKINNWTNKNTFSEYQKYFGININDELNDDFASSIQNLLDSKIGNQQVKRLESDFWLCYGLRNYSAHTIASQKLLWDKFTVILQSILNVFYHTIENL